MQDAITLSVKRLHVPVLSSAGTQKASQPRDGITSFFETIRKICGLAESLKLSEVCQLCIEYVSMSKVHIHLINLYVQNSASDMCINLHMAIISCRL